MECPIKEYLPSLLEVFHKLTYAIMIGAIFIGALGELYFEQADLSEKEEEFIDRVYGMLGKEVEEDIDEESEESEDEPILIPKKGKKGKNN